MPSNLPVLGPDLRQWGRQLNVYLSRNLGKLYFKTNEDNPSENGVFLWDDENNYPVVSAQSAFRQIAMKQATPSSSVGAPGNKTGMIAWDQNYIYICTADYDGSTAIWKRVSLTTFQAQKNLIDVGHTLKLPWNTPEALMILLTCMRVFTKGLCNFGRQRKVVW